MTVKNKLIYFTTAAVVALAICIRLFALRSAEALTIQPAPVEEDTTSSQLTEVEKKYVDEFLEQVNKDHTLTPKGYVTERLKSGEVRIEIEFEETDEIAVVRYDTYMDRWTGSVTLKGE